MMGTSLSGMTFISVPGTVAESGFGYLPVVIGYLIGYAAISFLLLPMYYRLRLTSIYTYLDQRFGKSSHRTAVVTLIVSRTLGTCIRLFLSIAILEEFVLSGMGISFEVTCLIIIGLILIYTFQGGVKTIVWTNALQTSCMLGSLIICALYIAEALNFGVSEVRSVVYYSGLTRVWETDPASANHFLKNIFGGMFINIAQNGLDQSMMQKTISIRKLSDSQKNILLQGILEAACVFSFLILGALLYAYGIAKGGSIQLPSDEPASPFRFLIGNQAWAADRVFPALVFEEMHSWISIVFVLGVISALLPSADGALTALTSSFCIDLLRIKEWRGPSKRARIHLRILVQVLFSILFVILLFWLRAVDNGSLILLLLKIAGYTYGPLLGLFAFGMLTRMQVIDRLVPFACAIPPIFCYVLSSNQQAWLGGYHIGIEMLPFNALLTFLLLFLIRCRHDGRSPISALSINNRPG